ncbi:histone deacetylase family protein [Halodurantibacterium flavum]|uniref:Histone deacetylase family protein n=1 Tax=Halodurantibacterium flavum TaxID=1382802 RepID=A0ABW4S8W6_9RHOB
MTTALLTHGDCLKHLTPPGHPEQVARLDAVMAALQAPEFAALQRIEAPLADIGEVLRVHPAHYLAEVKAAIPAGGNASLDEDTHLSPGSLDAALRAVGAATLGVDLVVAGQARNVFCATRPPGHHAETARAMGFCLFGTAAIAAKRALDHHGLSRVAVVDFDVHHGNGTQDLLWNEPRALFISSHQMPLYPGTGAPDERGAHDNVLNLPLADGSGGAEMRRVYQEMALPRLADFAPELIIISAGFDAHRADPLAGLAWDEDDFAWLTGQICDVAERTASGRVVSTLEGGYDLDALAASVAAHVRILMERNE